MHQPTVRFLPDSEYQGVLTEAIETSMDGFWIVDGAGRILEVNDAYVRCSGYSRGELLTMTIAELEAKESPAETAAHVGKVFRDGYDRFESVHRAKDGREWPVEVAASRSRRDGNRLFVFVRDISGRREAEAALREREVFLKRVIASSADCIKVLDLNGTLLSMSDGGQRLLEIDDLGTVLNTCWIDFWQECDREAVRQAIAVARDGGTGQFQACCPTGSGSPKWWDVIVTPIPNAQGAAERLLAVSRDVTERKLFEDRLQAARDEAERADHGKSRFLAAASHDLRQPFQAMRLLFEALGGAIPPPARPIYAKLDEAMRAGESLLSALLDVSLLEVGMVKLDVRAFPIDPVLDRLVAECAPQAQAKGLRLRRAGCGHTVVSDPEMLVRMLRNLLHNGIRYTRRGGLLVGCRRRGRQVLIQVWDTGIGIAASDLPYVFDEFYQVGNSERDRTKGLGLGLSVVAKTAKLLGHAVDLRSVEGKGSVFSVAVPVADEDGGPGGTRTPNQAVMSGPL